VVGATSDGVKDDCPLYLSSTRNITLLSHPACRTSSFWDDWFVSVVIATNLAFINRWESATSSSVTTSTEFKLKTSNSRGAARTSVSSALARALVSRQSQVPHLASLSTVEHLVAANLGVQIHVTGQHSAVSHTLRQSKGASSITYATVLITVNPGSDLPIPIPGCSAPEPVMVSISTPVVGHPQEGEREDTFTGTSRPCRTCGIVVILSLTNCLSNHKTER